MNQYDLKLAEPNQEMLNHGPDGMPPSFISNKHVNIFTDEDGNPHVYITENIDSPIYYLGLIRLLNNIPEDVKVHLHLNTPGGSMDTTVQLLAAMRRCKGEIIGYVEGSVASAGTIILLNCDSHVVEPGASFMSHYYSSGFGGKGQDIEAYADHLKSKYHKFFKDQYEGFFSKKELKKMLSGTDIWMGDEELRERLDKFREYHIRKHATVLFEKQEEMRTEELEKVGAYLEEVENAEPRSIEDIISLLKGEEPQMDIMQMISSAMSTMGDDECEHGTEDLDEVTEVGDDGWVTLDNDGDEAVCGTSCDDIEVPVTRKHKPKKKKKKVKKG
jgi:ATP-dependent protease ClpP protease subunit